MKVAIIGGGSVGLLMASFLAEYKIDVSILTRRSTQASLLNSNGLRRKNTDGSETTVSVKAMIAVNYLDQYDMIIVAVKYMQLQQVFQIFSAYDKLPHMLFLQNGLSHYDEAMQLPFTHLAFGSVTFGAQLEDDRTVIHRGIGAVNIANARGDDKLIKQLLTATTNLLPLQQVEDAEIMLFQKAFFNCLINPLTFLLQVKNGALLTESHAFALLKNLYEEMKAVFPESSSILFEHVEMLCQKTATNTSSMLSDRLGKRQTEIETIAGAMLKKAELKGADLPILRTLYHLVLQLEGDYLLQ